MFVTPLILPFVYRFSFCLFSPVLVFPPLSSLLCYLCLCPSDNDCLSIYFGLSSIDDMSKANICSNFGAILRDPWINEKAHNVYLLHYGHPWFELLQPQRSKIMKTLQNGKKGYKIHISYAFISKSVETKICKWAY